MKLTEKVKDFALRAGADIVGVVSVEHVDTHGQARGPIKKIGSSHEFVG